jgi:hypothetical protein
MEPKMDRYFHSHHYLHVEYAKSSTHVEFASQFIVSPEFEPCMTLKMNIPATFCLTYSLCTFKSDSDHSYSRVYCSSVCRMTTQYLSTFWSIQMHSAPCLSHYCVCKCSIPSCFLGRVCGLRNARSWQRLR